MPSPLNELFVTQQRGLTEDIDASVSSHILCFNFNAQDFFCPIAEVREVLEMAFLSPYPSIIPGHLGVISIRGKIIPVLSNAAFDYSFINLGNAGELNLTYRMMVFDSKSRGRFAIIVCKVNKQLMLSEAKTDSVLNVKGKPRRYFDVETFVDQIMSGVKQ